MNIRLLIESFFNKIGRDRVYNYSASTAFFLILSIFPFLILLLTVVQYTPLTEEFLLARLEFILPEAIYPLIKQIIQEIFSTTSGATLIFVSAIAGIWSASKGVMAMIRGINVCFNVDDKRSWINVRIRSCIYTLLLIIIVIFFLIFLVFGSVLFNQLQDQYEQYGSFFYIVKFLLKRKIIVSFFILTPLFMAVYSVLPAKHIKYWITFPGAALSAIGWIILSELLSLYLSFFPNFSYTYGSLTSFILFMLWLYFCCYILFVCAEINFFYKTALERAANKRKRVKTEKYTVSQEKKKMKADTIRFTEEEKETVKATIQNNNL